MHNVAAERLECGGLVLDFGAYKVTRDGVAARLGVIDLQILRCIVAEPGRVFSREELLDEVWRDNKVRSVRVIDGHIVRLRRALNRPGQIDAIRTVPSAGYTFGLPDVVAMPGQRASTS